MTRKIVAFIGTKGSGKSTAAAAMESLDFTEYKFADELKAMLRTLLMMRGLTYSQAQRRVEGDLKEEPSPFLDGHTPRYAMQTIGTEWGRWLMGPDFWLGGLLARLPFDGNIVISDARFPNEIEALRSVGAYIVKIERPGNGVSRITRLRRWLARSPYLAFLDNRHVSEIFADQFDEADEVLLNDFHTAEDFQDVVRAVVGHMVRDDA